jgi:hypothetical protein
MALGDTAECPGRKAARAPHRTTLATQRCSSVSPSVIALRLDVHTVSRPASFRKRQQFCVAAGWSTRVSFTRQVVLAESRRVCMKLERPDQQREIDLVRVQSSA